MAYYDPSSYRSPETKTEVKQAAKFLIGLEILFGITCDSEGCKMRRWKPTRGGGSRFDVKWFKWRDVTETKVSE